MSVTAEQKAQRRNTAAFIAANAIQLELIPRVRVKTASGYSTTDGAPRAAQFFRLIDQSSIVGNIPGRLRSSEGEQRKITYQLLGYWDALWAVGDHWVDTATGARFEIDELLPDNGYERRAKVIRYGPE